MAKIDLKFLDFFDEDIYIQVENETSQHYVSDEWKDKEVITITLNGYGNVETCIELDVSTAIKFAKTIRTEINKAKVVDYEG